MRRIVSVFCIVLLLISMSACGTGDDQISLLEAQLADAQAQAESLEAQLDAAEESYASAQDNWDAERENWETEQEKWEAEREELENQINQMLPIYQYADREISDELVQAAYEQRKDELILSAYFSQGVDAIFAEFTGEAVVRYDLDDHVNTAYTHDAYYWEGGNVSPEKAAAKLVEIMLKDVQTRNDCTFVLEKYRIDEQTLSDRDAMLAQWKDYVWRNSEDAAAYQNTDITRDMISEFIETLFPLWDDGTAYYRSEELPYDLGDDMWVFIPNFRVKFTGVYNMYHDYELSADMLDKDGYVHGQGDGSESAYRYILIRNGDVWRLQSCQALKKLDEQLR